MEGDMEISIPMMSIRKDETGRYCGGSKSIENPVRGIWEVKTIQRKRRRECHRW